MYRLSIYGKESIMNESKNLLSGYTNMLLLKLLESKDMYGYEMIEELAKRSDNSFSLKAGTLYPLLHSLEKDGMITSYEGNADSTRIRKYYGITKKGKKMLEEKTTEWKTHSSKINQVLEGGAKFVAI
jgi:PadR family transcriptional regulator PadR